MSEDLIFSIKAFGPATRYYFIPYIIYSIICAIIFVIPFLFFKKTRRLETLISLWFIAAGYWFASLFSYDFEIISHYSNLGNAQAVKIIVFILFLTLFAISPFILFKIIKRKKMKYFYMLFLVIFIYFSYFLDVWLMRIRGG